MIRPYAGIYHQKVNPVIRTLSKPTVTMMPLDLAANDYLKPWYGPQIKDTKDFSISVNIEPFVEDTISDESLHQPLIMDESA